MTQDLTTRIRAVRFTPVRLREGYDMAEVDTFLDELEQAVLQQAPLRPLVDRARFNPVRLREGYDMRDVDDFLEALVCDSEGVSAPVAASGSATSVDAAASVIQEERGLLSRLFGRK